MSTYTDDQAKVTTYNLRVKGWFTSYASNVASKDFTIIITDECNTNLSLVAPSLADQVYIIFDDMMQLPAFADFLVSPTYCTITYDKTISPAIPSQTLVILD